MLGYFMRFSNEDEDESEEDEYDWQIALELAIDAANNDMRYTYAGPAAIQQLDSETKLEYSYGLRLLPGYFISPRTLLFIDLGISIGHFKTNFLQEDFLAPANSDYVSSTDDLIGFRYGIGIEHFFTEQLSIGLEYAITNYEDYNITSIGFEESQDFVGLVEVNNKYEPTVSTGSLEFKYYFY